MVLIIDNYDSFTYNLVHYVEEITGLAPVVMQNDEVDFEAAEKFTHIILSPGPGLPAESGQLMEVINRFHATKKILGVCLGHQALGEYFGGKLENMPEVKHGVAEKIITRHTCLYKGLPRVFLAGRYHSWVVSKNGFPACMEVTSEDENGYIMSMQHTTLPVTGIQYHPESVLTEYGKEILKNWIGSTGNF